MRLRAALALLLFATGSTSVYAQNAWIRVKGAWEPEPSTLGALRAQLEPFVKSEAQTQRRQLRNWGDYVFQYQGQEEKGRKYVLANALCHKDRDWDLEERIIWVLDGGACFFHLKFDPQRQRYYDLVINGDA